MDQDPVFTEYLKFHRSWNAGEEGSGPRSLIEPDWELLERMTRQELIGVAIVLAVATAMAAVIRLSGF